MTTAERLPQGARLGRGHLRPRSPTPSSLGARAAGAPGAARRRGRARRRLRLGPGDRGAGRPGPRGRVYAVDVAPSMVEHARRGARRARHRSVPGPGRARATRAGRRGLLQRHVSLDPDHDALFAALHRRSGRAAGWWRSAAGRANIDALPRPARDEGRRSRARTAVRAVLRRLAAAVELRRLGGAPPAAHPAGRAGSRT